MKRTFKQRVLVTLAATLLAVAFGLLAGYWTGRKIALRQAASRLSREVALALDESEALSRDAQFAVVAMNNARNPDCSAEDMQFLHTILYRSYLLKEIGRLHGNRIACPPIWSAHILAPVAQTGLHRRRRCEGLP